MITNKQLAMVHKVYKKGFTLLELLVVIAIIGILAAITISYLGQSKDKGADAGVKSNLLNARSQVEVFYTNAPRSYLGVCNNAVTGIFKHVQAAQKAYGGSVQGSYSNAQPSTYNTEQCHDAINTYVVWVPLRSSTLASPQGLCIDSANATRVSNGVLPGSQTFCP